MRVPAWWLGVEPRDVPRVHIAFARLLASLALTQTSLAKDLDLDHSTVNKWALPEEQSVS